MLLRRAVISLGKAGASFPAGAARLSRPGLASSRNFSILRFTRCRALSMDLTWRPQFIGNFLIALAVQVGVEHILLQAAEHTVHLIAEGNKVFPCPMISSSGFCARPSTITSMSVRSLSSS